MKLPRKVVWQIDSSNFKDTSVFEQSIFLEASPRKLIESLVAKLVGSVDAAGYRTSVEFEGEVSHEETSDIRREVESLLRAAPSPIFDALARYTAGFRATEGSSHLPPRNFDAEKGQKVASFPGRSDFSGSIHSRASSLSSFREAWDSLRNCFEVLLEIRDTSLFLFDF